MAEISESNLARAKFLISEARADVLKNRGDMSYERQSLFVEVLIALEALEKDLRENK